VTPEELFQKHFAPLYPAGESLDALRARDANPAGNPAILAKLDELASTFEKLAPVALAKPDLELARDDASVHRLAVLLDREARDRWANERREDGASTLAKVVVHGAVWVGACIVATRGDQARWRVRNPLWESRVELTSAAGVGDLAPFMWWLKALSDEEIERPSLGDRYRTHVEVPTFDAASLPVIAPPDRRVPRLAKVRYDALFRHLKAHVPEIASVGDDFPSPARLDELAFKWLEGRWLGGGRMLLLSGPTRDGFLAMWMSLRGFEKSAYFEADAGFTPIVDVDGDKVRFVVRSAGRDVVHEMLWWGA
jgi:hypothetical protein